MDYTKIFNLKKYFCTAIVVIALSFGGIASHGDIAQRAEYGPNIVKNAGFEDGTAHWSIPDVVANVVDTESHSGKRSLYYTNTDAKRYKLFSQDVVAQPGERLSFSVWIKGENVSSEKGNAGVGIYMQSYGNGNFIGGAYPPTADNVGTFGWKRVSGEMTVLPGAVRTSVGLYLRPGVTGTVWFDDVEVRVLPPTPFTSILRFPNYRGIVKQGVNTPWKFSVGINVQPEWKKGDVIIRNVLTDAREKVLFDESRKVPSTDKSADIELNVPNLPAEKYTLKQTITDPNGQIGFKQEYPIQVLSEMPKVYTDQDGFTVADGKRFFPWGLYLQTPMTGTEDLQRISKGGFNTVLSYHYGIGKDFLGFMDSAQENNLKVIYSIKDMYPGHGKYKEDAFDIAAGYVKKIKNKPALLSWYTNDEFGPEWLPQLKKMYNQVTVLDPNHPTYQVLVHTNDLEKYFDSTDILGTDPYPVGSADLTKTSINTRITGEAVHHTKGVWMVPQMMDWELYPSHGRPNPHFPSLDELRNQAYQAIINGATGLIFFNYYNLGFADKTRTFNETLFKERWNLVTQMSEEINAIIPVILENNKVALKLPKDARIEASALQEGNQLLLLMANPYYEQKSITFELPKGWRIIEANQGQIKSTFDNGKVTFTLPSMGSGVFRLVKTNN